MGYPVSVAKDKFLILSNLSVILVGCFFVIGQFRSSSEALVVPNRLSLVGRSRQDCKRLHDLDGYKAKCMYVKHNSPCVSQGYVDYLYIFYCSFGCLPWFGYGVLFLWMVILFYLLGNTASEYFCTSLDSLSKVLKLSPAIAGVTLLSLGNGAPDVFASLVSFMGNGTRDIGLNSVVGGASFVSCFVVGVISILLHKKHVRIVKSDFVRDLCFYIVTLVFLAVILINGAITLWEAVGFSSLYVLYVVVVYITHSPWVNNGGDSIRRDSDRDTDLVIPILDGMQDEEVNCVEEGCFVADEGVKSNRSCFCSRGSTFCGVVLCIIKMPLHLPRRLTIPVVSAENWSKPHAVASVAIAPLLSSALWIPHSYLTFETSLAAYGVAMLIGVVLGILAYLKTEDSMPPRKCLFPWLAGGFLMSITWTYVLAQELVGSLISLGYVLEISPAILGLTVLAWGNSIGDLITNTTMALNGGAEGAQIAISACYAGPIFNILFGLGLSLVGSCLYGYPSVSVIPKNSYVLETLGFLAIGLLWALLMLPLRRMRLDGILGGGLLVIYFVSLSIRLIQTVGIFLLDQSTMDPKNTLW